MRCIFNDSQEKFPFSQRQSISIHRVHWMCCAIFHALFLSSLIRLIYSPNAYKETQHRKNSTGYIDLKQKGREEMSTFIDWDLNHSSLLWFIFIQLSGIRFDKSLNGWMWFQYAAIMRLTFLHIQFQLMCCNSLSLCLFLSHWCQYQTHSFYASDTSSVRYEIISNHQSFIIIIRIEWHKKRLTIN